MGPRALSVCLAVVIGGCAVPVQIGQPVDDAGAGGSSVGGGSVGGGSAGGEGGGSSGGGTAGGSTGGGSAMGGGAATGGGPGGSGGDCAAGLSCEGVGGTAYFSCIDPAAPNGFPAGAPVCSESMHCAVGWGCFVESESASTGSCLRACNGTTVRGIPQWVGAGPEALTADAGTLSLTGPAGADAADLYLAIIDADEAAGPLAVTAPAGWSLLSGWPIHNLASAYGAAVSPSWNHGLWVYWAWSPDTSTLVADFTFDRAATARGVVLAYRGVNTRLPINDKLGFGAHSDGRTNGQGSGNTTLETARQVTIVASCPTSFPYRIEFQPSPKGDTQRLFSGEQANGLELLVFDRPIYPNLYFGPSVRFLRPPTNDSISLMFAVTTVLLKPNTTP